MNHLVKPADFLTFTGYNKAVAAIVSEVSIPFIPSAILYGKQYTVYGLVS